MMYAGSGGIMNAEKPLWETNPEFSHINQGLKVGERVFIKVWGKKVYGTIADLTEADLQRFILPAHKRLGIVVAVWDDDGKINFEYAGEFSVCDKQPESNKTREKNGTNEICYFCSKPTEVMFGRQMWCPKCGK